MKILPLLLLSVVCSFAQSSFTNNRPFKLFFEDTNDFMIRTAAVFRAHSSPVLALPVEQWQVVGELSGVTEVTNFFPIIASTNIQFFAVSISNEWGIVFSEPIATMPPRGGSRLRLVPE